MLFLHADTQLSGEALEALLTLPDDILWGRFDVDIQGQSRLFPLISFFINWRSRLSGIATGDQAIFVQSSLLHRIGLFPVQDLMEDIELSKRLKRIRRPICLKNTVMTSGRRWDQRGVWRTIFLMWRLRLSYWLGKSPEAIAREYQ